MNDDRAAGETRSASAAWFATTDSDDVSAASDAIRTGRADLPEDWPQQAVETGFVESEEAYYELLQEVTIHTAREDVAECEQADDQQLVHAIRALDDCRETVNELTERVVEWAGTHDPEATVDVDYVRELAAREPESPVERRVIALAGRVAGLDDEVEQLRTYIERTTPEVAPNLSEIAGPELAARLISLAGGLESLAKKPSGTVQVLGAEDALFAHLRGGAPSPKHGIIYTHEYVRGTNPEHRGSAARALAGKLSIAARIDHYSGEYRPELAAELEDRIERIRARDDA